MMDVSWRALILLTLIFIMHHISRIAVVMERMWPLAQ